MEQDICMGGVAKVVTKELVLDGVQVVKAYIHHSLPEELLAHLVHEVQRAIVQAVEDWAA